MGTQKARIPKLVRTRGGRLVKVETEEQVDRIRRPFKLKAKHACGRRLKAFNGKVYCESEGCQQPEVKP